MQKSHPKSRVQHSHIIGGPIIGEPISALGGGIRAIIEGPIRALRGGPLELHTLKSYL